MLSTIFPFVTKVRFADHRSRNLDAQAPASAQSSFTSLAIVPFADSLATNLLSSLVEVVPDRVLGQDIGAIYP